MLFVSIVTAPVSATTRPDTLTLAVTVMLTVARMVPANEVPVPSVAEVPTCQKTFDPPHSVPASSTTTAESLAVVSVVPIWNTQGPAPVR